MAGQGARDAFAERLTRTIHPQGTRAGRYVGAGPSAHVHTTEGRRAVTTNELGIPVNNANRDPRVACALVVDTSYSMIGAPIEALEAGFEQFRTNVQQDPVARKRAEITVVTFNTHAEILVPFQEARALSPVRFTADGSTNMAEGINVALDEVEDRKRAYRADGIETYRPWFFLLTDGAPNPGDEIDVALARLNAAERAKKVTVFPVGVGEQVDWAMLARASAERTPIKLAGLESFTAMFLWLSASLSTVSSSGNHSADDAAAEQITEQIALPPISGWATVV